MKLWRWLVILAALVAAGIALRLTVLSPKPVKVRLAKVERGVVEETVSNSRAGTVKVRRRAKLSPQIGGLVVALPHREGDSVAAGELLLALDDRLQQAELELYRRGVMTSSAQAQEACLAAELAAKELTRAQALQRQGITSDQQLDALASERDRTRAGCEAARAAVEQARGQVATAGVLLALTKLEAPFAGIVADISTEVGEWITPSPPGVPLPPVIDLLDPGSVYISAPIDEVDAERVKLGLPARVTVDSRPGMTYAASVSRIAPYVLDQLEQNRTVEVEAELADASAVTGLLPGTSADVEVILDSRQGVLRIPTAAVAEGNKVLVLSTDTLVERTIEAGLSNWQFTEVVGGLAEGDAVVVSRASPEVKPGAKAVAETNG